MKVGDLVKVKREHLDWAIACDRFGVIINIIPEFYNKAHNWKTSVDKLIILWGQGHISGDPSSYVEKI